jgi:hypothetical protein
MSNADTLSDQGSGMHILQRSSMILSSLPPQMTTQLFACAFKRRQGWGMSAPNKLFSANAGRRSSLPLAHIPW